MIAVYDLGTWEPQRVAEFRLTPEYDVTLDLLTTDGCPIAEQWYRHGVEIYGRSSVVTPSEGPAFMRALLQPFQLSYYRFVDESPGSAS
ncbi:hypothetical protein IU474_31415 [Nocardia otitidiscaviarum]|uniref:hypothetical protein n=1 Tax=Nocardia otitidiscaviarum TaxID=1823 RepID=UPI001895AA6A|nr:hypothetical protein [Nocardia otitidiscaviarum]MBF6241554.1 hypothetical protein [Nocardia otitidiscaviarum]